MKLYDAIIIQNVNLLLKVKFTTYVKVVKNLLRINKSFKMKSGHNIDFRETLYMVNNWFVKSIRMTIY